MKIDKEELLKEYIPKIKDHTKKLVSIKSFKQKPGKGHPVDPEVEKALDYALDLAKSFGFKIFKSKDKRYGYADYGNKEKLFGILCHLDVVPAGDLKEWKTDPWTLTELDGNLYGRGVYDDKGPTIVNLYAIKYLIDKGFEFDYTIRFIFGTTEETTWECMDSYVKNERHVDAGYVPDGNFPVVYAEKYIADIDITGNETCDFELNGGEVYNAVCDLAWYKGPLAKQVDEYIKKNTSVYSTYWDEEKLFVKGKSSHGSLPERGHNSGTYLCQVLTKIGVKHKLVNFVSEYVHDCFDLHTFIPNIEDETGNLTSCNGIIRIANKDFRLTFNLRIPCHSDPDKDVIEKFNILAKEKDFICKVVSREDKVHEDINGKVIKSIMEAYIEVTNDQKAKPIAIGGGTFAKSMPNIVAFGAEFDITKSTMHTPNEVMSLQNLEDMLLIYVKSLAKLTKI